MSVTRFASLAAAAALGLGACTPPSPGTSPAPRAPAPLEYRPLTAGLPAIPRVDGPAAIRVVHPTPDSPRPGVDSTFIYGSVGTGDAALVINGVQVPVAPNGAFIAYLPTPERSWELVAYRGGAESRASVSYRAPAGPSASETRAAAAGSTPEGEFDSPRAGVVTGGDDELATGSDAAYARVSPTGAYRWFFPRGARLELVERRRGQYRVRLDTASAWIDTTAVSVRDAGAAATAATARLAAAPGATDLRIAAGFAPFLVQTGPSSLSVTVYGRGPVSVSGGGAGFVRRATSEGGPSNSSRVVLELAGAPWGYRAFYEADGTLVVRVRQPPAIDAAAPVRGVRIVIDPGHPPAGAHGPTGLYEGEANLAISTRLAERLRAAGAEVILTRTGPESVELGARTELAVSRDAHLLVSVHNNAFGEGQNPFRAHHTSTYYFHGLSEDLARALNQEIAAVALIPNRGALWGNLALVRPTWMPSVLTESLFMPIPEQENALRDPAFLDRLAEAHFRGIEAFLRSRAGQ